MLIQTSCSDSESDFICEGGSGHFLKVSLDEGKTLMFRGYLIPGFMHSCFVLRLPRGSAPSHLQPVMAEQGHDIMLVSKTAAGNWPALLLQQHRPNGTHKWSQSMRVRCIGFFQSGCWGLSADWEPRGLAEGLRRSNCKCQK